MRVGYCYIPPSHGVNGQPMILDWFADEEVGFAAIEDTHVKVAYVQETSDSGLLLHSVYLNTLAHPAISPTLIILPDGWSAVSMYTHNDASTLMIIAKVAGSVTNHDFFQNPNPVSGNIFFDNDVHTPAPVDTAGYALSPAASFPDSTSQQEVADSVTNHNFFQNQASGNIFFDDSVHTSAPVDTAGYALSPVDSFTPDSTSIYGNSDIFSMVESNWMNPAPVSPTMPSVALTLPPYDLPMTHVHTSLLPHGSVVGAQNPPSFVGCSLEVFQERISYTPAYLKAHFPAAWTIISDARIAAKNYLHVNHGGEAAFMTYCIQAITEMQTFASASPQPAELGLRCRETGQVESLNILDSNIVEMLYLERNAFIKAMRSRTQSFVEEEKKAILGGFDLKRKKPEEAKTQIEALTGMSHWSNDVKHLAFTFDAAENKYRSTPLLAILAHRLLRPVSGHHMSLINLFPESYTSLPKHLICKICTLIVAFFREHLSDHEYTFTHAPDEEHRHQLELLAEARRGPDAQSMELERWLTTRQGPNGWQAKLEQVLKQCNALRGPKRK